MLSRLRGQSTRGFTTRSDDFCLIIWVINIIVVTPRDEHSQGASSQLAPSTGLYLQVDDKIVAEVFKLNKAFSLWRVVDTRLVLKDNNRDKGMT